MALHCGNRQDSSVLNRLYLDHAATTPLLPEAVEAMARAYEVWANPSSPHAEGRASRAVLEAARKTIADVLGWRHDVILTSGASESIAIAAKAAKPERRLVGATEHEVVPAAMGEGAIVLPVDADGLIDMDALDAALDGEPALVAIQQVNNETGVIQPMAAIAERVRAAGSLLLADCAQGAGKLDLARRRFHRGGGAQARRPAGGRRLAGPRPRDAACLGRTGERLSARHTGGSRGCRLCRRARGARLRRGHAAPDRASGQARR